MISYISLLLFAGACYELYQLNIKADEMVRLKENFLQLEKDRIISCNCKNLLWNEFSNQEKECLLNKGITEHTSLINLSNY